jgi:hypothetical protein
MSSPSRRYALRVLKALLVTLFFVGALAFVGHFDGHNFGDEQGDVVTVLPH